jgi:hypothetical protein
MSDSIRNLTVLNFYSNVKFYKIAVQVSNRDKCFYNYAATHYWLGFLFDNSCYTTARSSTINKQ